MRAVFRGCLICGVVFSRVFNRLTCGDCVYGVFNLWGLCLEGV